MQVVPFPSLCHVSTALVGEKSRQERGAAGNRRSTPPAQARAAPPNKVGFESGEKAEEMYSSSAGRAGAEKLGGRAFSCLLYNAGAMNKQLTDSHGRHPLS